MSWCAPDARSYASSSRRVRAQGYDLKFLDPNSKETSRPAPLGVLVDRAIEITGRNFKLFATVTLLTLCAQTLLYFFVRGPNGVNLAALALAPLITTIANIRCALDLRAADISARELIGWAFGRLWAVILIDFVFSFAFSEGSFQMLLSGGDIGAVLTGVLTIVLTSTLAFADVYASIEPQRNALLTLPLAFMRSITLAWQNGNMLRIVMLAVLQVALALVTIMLQQFFELKHIHGAVFFANIPVATLFCAPFAVLTTVMYFDCLAREREATS